MKQNNYLLKAAAATTLMLASSMAVQAAYPAAGSFDGQYKFSAGLYEFNSEDFGAFEVYFPQEFTFDIVTEGGAVKIKNFFNTTGIDIGSVVDNTLKTTYNQSTGILTIDAYTYRPDIDLGKWFGFAPNGVFTGITASTGTPLRISILEDGTIKFPDFEMVTYEREIVNGSYGDYVIKDVVVDYSNITVTPYKSEVVPPEAEEPIPGTEAYEGMWNVELDDHYQGEESLNVFAQAYEAHVVGRTLRLLPIEEYGYGDYEIIGVFTDAVTLEIQKAMVRDAIYPLYMIPYINTNGTNSLAALGEEPFTVSIVNNNGNISFKLPEGKTCGVKYGYFNKITGQRQQDWLAAFDFVSFTRTGDFQPVVTISSLRPVTTGASVTVTFDVAYQNFDGIVPASWQAELTQFFQDNVEETEWTENHTLVATVNGGKGSFTFDGCKAGRNLFQVYITALDANGNVIVSSNAKDFTAESDKFFDLNNTTWQVEDNELTVSCRVTPNNVRLSDIAEFRGVLTQVDSDNVYTTTVASVNNGMFTGKFNIPNSGTYDFTFAVNGYDANGTLIAITNFEQYLENVKIGDGGSEQPDDPDDPNTPDDPDDPNTPDDPDDPDTPDNPDGPDTPDNPDGPQNPDDSGVNGINADSNGVRYFTLQGVEIKNPVKGQIVIKIENGKAAKAVF